MPPRPTRPQTTVRSLWRRSCRSLLIAGADCHFILTDVAWYVPVAGGCQVRTKLRGGLPPTCVHVASWEAAAEAPTGKRGAKHSVSTGPRIEADSIGTNAAL